MRSNLLNHKNLMLRSERRERLEAWAASDLQISHSQYWAARPSLRLRGVDHLFHQPSETPDIAGRIDGVTEANDHQAL